MADTQTMAAVQEILLNARIRFTTGTEAEWTAANPVLLDGEVGFVKATNPVKFKVGDGTKKWSELGWGNPTSLAQLAADATHRLVTDTQIAGWNAKAEKTVASASSDGLMSKTDKSKLDGVAAGANNYTHPSTHPATMIVLDPTHRFVTDAEKTKWNTAADAEEYTLEKVTTASGFAATYQLKKGTTAVGTAINIPLDQVLRGSSIKSVATANTPYTGAKVGDKYIEFLFQNNNTPQYLPVQDLVDVYNGDGKFIVVDEYNIISVKITELYTELKKRFDADYDAKGDGASAAQTAIDEFKNSSFVIQCTIPGM